MIQPIPVATWACLKINEACPNAKFAQVFPEFRAIVVDVKNDGGLLATGQTGVFGIQHSTIANYVEILVTPFGDNTVVKTEYAPLYISFSLN